MNKISILIASLLITSHLQAQNLIIEACKDSTTGKFIARADKDIVAIDEKNNRGFRLWLSFRYKDSSVRYAHFGVISENIGSCMDKDQILIVFTDSTKYASTSWNEYNCSGDSYFDRSSSDFGKLSKEISYIVFTNGRSKESYTYFTTQEQSRYFIGCQDAIKNNRFIIKNCDD